MVESWLSASNIGEKPQPKRAEVSEWIQSWCGFMLKEVGGCVKREGLNKKPSNPCTESSNGPFRTLPMYSPKNTRWVDLESIDLGGKHFR